MTGDKGSDDVVKEVHADRLTGQEEVHGHRNACRRNGGGRHNGGHRNGGHGRRSACRRL